MSYADTGNEGSGNYSTVLVRDEQKFKWKYIHMYVFHLAMPQSSFLLTIFLIYCTYDPGTSVPTSISVGLCEALCPS